MCMSARMSAQSHAGACALDASACLNARIVGARVYLHGNEPNVDSLEYANDHVDTPRDSAYATAVAYLRFQFTPDYLALIQ